MPQNEMMAEATESVKQTGVGLELPNAPES